LGLLWMILRRIAFGTVSRGANLEAVRALLSRLPFYADQSLSSSSMPDTIVTLFGVSCLIYGFVGWNGAGRMVMFWGICWPVFHLFPLVAVQYASPRHILLAVAGPVVVLSLAATMLWRERRIVPIAAVAICMIIGFQFATRTTRSLPLFEASSQHSRQLSQLLKDGTYDSDAVVVLSSAPPVPVWFWQWALPFAVEPPFMDLRARIVAPSDWYCCAGWQAKRESMVREIASGTVKRVHQIDFNPTTNRFEEQPAGSLLSVPANP
jgi:hypothetical protein